jgi:hypothetical protein
MELVITSDDVVTPVKSLNLMAYTIWSDSGCTGDEKDKERCYEGQQGYPCCDDEDEEEC